MRLSMWPPSMIQENKDRNSRIRHAGRSSPAVAAVHDPGEQGSKPGSTAVPRPMDGNTPRCMIQENKDRNPISAMRHGRPTSSRRCVIQENKDRNLFREMLRCLHPGVALHDPGEQGSKPSGSNPLSRCAQPPSMIQENKDRNCELTAIAHAGSGRPA